MNLKEIGEIRRHIRRDRSNMTEIYGCYVNEAKQIVSEFRQSTSLMPENEAEKYFAMLRKTLSGTVGKNLIDIGFQTAQVVSGKAHKLLMQLRESRLKEEQLREQFYKAAIESLELDSAYLILLGCDSYDVPFKSKDEDNQNDASDQVYTYLVCAICPVKQTKAALHYDTERKEFHDGGVVNAAAAPEVGFLFPAFDNRSTNIYNALYYTHSTKQGQDGFAKAVFDQSIPAPAQQQKKEFDAILMTALGDECSLDVVQTVHEQLNQRIELHKESKVPEPLLIGKEEVRQALTECGISETHMAKFSVDFEQAFGVNAHLHPKNIIESSRMELKLPDVSIKVAKDRMDLIETRVIDGTKYILINAEENVEVNGVSIHISDKEALNV